MLKTTVYFKWVILQYLLRKRTHVLYNSVVDCLPKLCKVQAFICSTNERQNLCMWAHIRNPNTQKVEKGRLLHI